MSVKTIFEGKHLYVRERDGWEYVERKSATEAVAVVATTTEGKLILTEQERQPLGKRVIDWPAGLVGDEGNDDPAATAKKELEEEAGFTCAEVERLAGGPSSAGITSEIVTYYRARDARRSGAGGGVGGEKIAVHLVERATVREWLAEREAAGLLIDLKIWGGLFFLERER